MNPRVAIALALLAAFALGGAVLAAGGRDGDHRSGARFQGALLPPAVRAPDFRLRDERGRPLTMRQWRGRPVVVTFLYTHCHDTCPVTAQTVRGALDDLGHDLPALAISVDPPNDTPASARAFLAKQRALGRIHFALGSRARLVPVWRGYAIAPQRPRQEHQARIVLVDRRGYQRVGYPASQATPEALAHDLRLLERG